MITAPGQPCDAYAEFHRLDKRIVYIYKLYLHQSYNRCTMQCMVSFSLSLLLSFILHIFLVSLIVGFARSSFPPFFNSSIFLDYFASFTFCACFFQACNDDTNYTMLSPPRNLNHRDDHRNAENFCTQIEAIYRRRNQHKPWASLKLWGSNGV